tara:strand:+ start:85 stop:318 length:234 start_codon:yes stop_codon:yes gene_type:complete
MKLLDNISDCCCVDFCGTSCTLDTLAKRGCELHSNSIHRCLKVMQLKVVNMFQYQQCLEGSFIGNELQLKSEMALDD